MSRPRAYDAKQGKPLRLVGPEPDPHVDKQHTDSFKEAERLAIEHGLGYLSISGLVKLSCLIAAVRDQNASEETSVQET
jgi:hypothetical protein